MLKRLWGPRTLRMTIPLFVMLSIAKHLFSKQCVQALSKRFFAELKMTMLSMPNKLNKYAAKPPVMTMYVFVILSRERMQTSRRIFSGLSIRQLYQKFALSQNKRQVACWNP